MEEEDERETDRSSRDQWRLYVPFFNHRKPICVPVAVGINRPRRREMSRSHEQTESLSLPLSKVGTGRRQGKPGTEWIQSQ